MLLQGGPNQEKSWGRCHCCIYMVSLYYEHKCTRLPPATSNDEGLYHQFCVANTLLLCHIKKEYPVRIRSVVNLFDGKPTAVKVNNASSFGHFSYSSLLAIFHCLHVPPPHALGTLSQCNFKSHVAVLGLCHRCYILLHIVWTLPVNPEIPLISIVVLCMGD